MKTKIEEYNTAKLNHGYCKGWASLIGASYIGGGGGIGRLVSVTLADGQASPTIYFQESDGATNYHYMPAELKKHLEASIKVRFNELLADAFKRQETELNSLAVEAAKEYGSMMKAAGLTPSTNQEKAA